MSTGELLSPAGLVFLGSLETRLREFCWLTTKDAQPADRSFLGEVSLAERGCHPMELRLSRDLVPTNRGFLEWF